MQIKAIKNILIISIIFLLISIFPSTAFAGWVSDAQNFLNAQYGDDGIVGTDDDFVIGINDTVMKEATSGIYNMFRSVGMIITVVVGLILGITFMIASANDKAEVKQALVPYLIGCVVIYGAFGIWDIIVKTFDNI